MEVISESVIRFIDESIEKRGTLRGIVFVERRLRHLTINFKTNQKESVISDYLLDNFEKFERLLRVLGYLNDKQGIGAYHVKGKVLTVYIVSKLGKVLLM